MISSDEASLGDREDASKQGRKMNDIDKDAKITLVDETQRRYGDDLMFDTGVFDDEEVFAELDMAEKEINVAEKEVSIIDPVTIAGEVVTTSSVQISTAKPTETTITDDLTLAQTLIEIRSANPKVKGVVIGEQTMRAQEKRNKPPTKAQKRKTMSTYLKNMAGYKHNQLKNKSFNDIQKLFDKAIKRVNTFVDMDTELVEGCKTRAEESSKRA
ncbi:hypothetical protein Tco_0143033 [Tanacetum coccineum]